MGLEPTFISLNPALLAIKFLLGYRGVQWGQVTFWTMTPVADLAEKKKKTTYDHWPTWCLCLCQSCCFLHTLTLGFTSANNFCSWRFVPDVTTMSLFALFSGLHIWGSLKNREQNRLEFLLLVIVRNCGYLLLLVLLSFFLTTTTTRKDSPYYPSRNE